MWGGGGTEVTLKSNPKTDRLRRATQKANLKCRKRKLVTNLQVHKSCELSPCAVTARFRACAVTARFRACAVTARFTPCTVTATFKPCAVTARFTSHVQSQLGLYSRPMSHHT